LSKIDWLWSKNFSGDMRGNGYCLFLNFKGMHAREKTSKCVLHLYWISFCYQSFKYYGSILVDINKLLTVNYVLRYILWRSTVLETVLIITDVKDVLWSDLCKGHCHVFHSCVQAVWLIGWCVQHNGYRNIECSENKLVDGTAIHCIV